MTRINTALFLLSGVAVALAAGSSPLWAEQPAAAVRSEPRIAVIDQAGWNARKQRVRLPNGIELAYVELGDPAGRPVLLLHGVTDSSRTWTMLAPYLAGHRVIIPDQRGHGGSSAPACCYSPAHFTEDALHLLDALGIRRTAVVGHSLGSMVAQGLAADHPERVSGLALIGSTALPPVVRGNWMWEQFMALREPVASNTQFLRQWSLAASPTPVSPELVRYTDPEAAAVPLHVWRGVLREFAALPVGRHAADVSAPVLILSGGRDELFTAEHHRSLVAAYPTARAQVFPELGHNLIVERPHELGPVLAAFLSAPLRTAER